MKQQLLSFLPYNSAPTWPLNLGEYDSDPDLTEVERDELARIFRLSTHPTSIRQQNRALARLVKPVRDALAYVHADRATITDTIRFAALEMHQRGKAFWGWTIDEWCECLCQDDRAFSLRFERGYVKGAKGRLGLAVLVYVLCPHISVDLLVHRVKFNSFAQKILGREVLQEVVLRLQTVLRSWGHRQKESVKLTTCVGYLCLRNHSPNLEDLTIEFLEAVAQDCLHRSVQDKLFQVSNVLVTLGMIKRPLRYVFGKGKGTTRNVENDNDGSISEEWFSWCQR